MAVPNVVNYIQKHRVLISTNDAQSLCLGSGTLIRIADKSFVITAQHVINQHTHQKLFINLGVPCQDDSFMVKNICSNADLDIAYMELDTVAVDNFRKDIEPVVFKKAVPSYTIAPNYRAVAIIGYPGIKMKLDSPTTYSAGTFHILSQLVKEENWPAALPLDKSKFMLIQYGEKHGQQFVDQDGSPVSGQIDPSGLSGSAIWKFNPETMNSELPEYALWGILNHWHPGEQVLVGTYIQPLYDKIVADNGISF